MILGSGTRKENRILAHERLGPSHLLSKLAQSPWTLRLLISALLVIPCVWQPIVSVVDLQSHLYNATRCCAAGPSLTTCNCVRSRKVNLAKCLRAL
jgi:hypothetical protein